MSIPINDGSLPQAVTRLRLCTALRNCGREKVADCLMQSDAIRMYVYDDNGVNGVGYTVWSDLNQIPANKCFIANKVMCFYLMFW